MKTIHTLYVLTSIVVFLASSGCTKIYSITAYDRQGRISGTFEFESYVGGDQTYTLNQEWYEDGELKVQNVGFSRNISSLVGKALDGLAKAVGAGANKF